MSKLERVRHKYNTDNFNKLFEYIEYIEKIHINVYYYFILYVKFKEYDDMFKVYYNKYKSIRNETQFNVLIKELEGAVELIEKYGSLAKDVFERKDLKKLPELKEDLAHLYCYENELTELPDLPKTLKYLYCDTNLLKELPVLPEDLEDLQCYDNPIKRLPKLPKSLKYLSCDNWSQLEGILIPVDVDLWIGFTPEQIETHNKKTVRKLRKYKIERIRK